MKKTLFSVAAAFALFCCCSCAGGGDSLDLSEYQSLAELRLSSFYGTEEGDCCRLKMKAPYSDTYSVSFSEKYVENITFYSEEGKELVSAASDFEITLEEDEVVYIKITPVESTVRMTVSAQEHTAQLPFALAETADIDSYSVDSVSGDPLTAAEITYTKREGGLYVYSNTPEDLTSDVINTALTRQNVSDREVFFTYEHSSNDIKGGCYYGYRVRNTGTEDIYVTVKNIGFQTAGPGSYYGEKEWTNFYNTQFALPDMSGWTDAQKANFEAYYAFGGNYLSLDYQPVTYRIPAGEFMYVIGGTTEDAYNHYNVANTANNKVNGNCQNGAVLFEVSGEAEGAFFVYDDIEAIRSDTTSHIGDSCLTACYNGTDEGIVVDSSAAWEFNDYTPAQSLPVAYTNYYLDDAEQTGTPYAKIASEAHRVNTTVWWTHSNVQAYPLAVGTDMTDFHTVSSDGTEVVIGNDTYDGRGRIANIGNWMKDYIDTYTFVNRGDNEREITVKMKAANGGCFTVMVRDTEGNLVEGTDSFALYRGNTEYGDEIDGSFEYTVTVPAHTVLRFSVEYNLMANSNGSITHEVVLK